MTESSDRSPASGFWNFAWEYAEAAKKVVGEPELKHAAYYLICHSIELTLKAFLRTKGWEIDALRILGHNGHDLDAALSAAEGVGLREFYQIENGSRLVLGIYNIAYMSKDFEYTFLLPELPELTSPRHMTMLLDVAVNLLETTHGFILKSHGGDR
jgi:hypothetical protein